MRRRWCGLAGWVWGVVGVLAMCNAWGARSPLRWAAGVVPVGRRACDEGCWPVVSPGAVRAGAAAVRYGCSSERAECVATEGRRAGCRGRAVGCYCLVAGVPVGSGGRAVGAAGGAWARAWARANLEDLGVGGAGEVYVRRGAARSRACRLRQTSARLTCSWQGGQGSALPDVAIGFAWSRLGRYMPGRYWRAGGQRLQRVGDLFAASGGGDDGQRRQNSSSLLRLGYMYVWRYVDMYTSDGPPPAGALSSSAALTRPPCRPALRCPWPHDAAAVTSSLQPGQGWPWLRPSAPTPQACHAHRQSPGRSRARREPVAIASRHRQSRSAPSFAWPAVAPLPGRLCLCLAAATATPAPASTSSPSLSRQASTSCTLYQVTPATLAARHCTERLG